MRVRGRRSLRPIAKKVFYLRHLRELVFAQVPPHQEAFGLLVLQEFGQEVHLIAEHRPADLHHQSLIQKMPNQRMPNQKMLSRAHS